MVLAAFFAWVGDGARRPSPGKVAAAFLLLAVVAACAGTDSGPLVQCRARDGAGNQWIARDIDPLSAQERALIDCGAQSETPDSCVAVSCDRQW